MLARVVRKFLVFSYAHNIPVVVAAAMDPKAKASAPTYGVINLEGRLRKRKSGFADPAASAKPLMVTVYADAGGQLVAKRVVSPPLGVEDFDITKMELMTK